MIFAALAFAGFLIPLCGLAIDASTAYAARTQLMMALDAAVMSGARALANGRNSAEQVANATARARAVALANLPPGGLAGTIVFETVEVVQPSDFRRQFNMTARVEVPTYFMRWFGYTSLPVRGTSQAVRRDVNLSMVLDRSGSLRASASCDPMKNAAIAFSQRFAEGRDNMGLVTFATSLYTDFPMGSNFRSGALSVPGEIATINCDGGTNMPGGLWRGYEQLTSLRQPDALNVILLFTDGQPTAAPLELDIQAGSTCVDKSRRQGVLYADGGWMGGIFRTQLPTRPLAGDDSQVIANAAGCAFNANSARVANDIDGVPAVDINGNALNGAYQPVVMTGGRLRADRANVANGIANAVDSAAARIRAGVNTAAGPGLENVLVFTIGLGAGVNDDLLRRVANDKASTSFDADKPAGSYIFVSSAAALDEAFQRVASEVLRLAM